MYIKGEILEIKNYLFSFITFISYIRESPDLTLGFPLHESHHRCIEGVHIVEFKRDTTSERRRSF